MFRDEDQEDRERKVHVLFNRTLHDSRCKASDGGVVDLALLIQDVLHSQRQHYPEFKSEQVNFRHGDLE
jgi:hypothetical protein